MTTLHITPDQARIVALNAQQLLVPPPHPAVKSDILQAIRTMGALQIDTINVVARSPYLSLWSRIGDYNPAWLDELLAEREIFEYWAHAASFLPLEDYPLYRRICLDGLRFHRYREWYNAHRTDCDQILEHVRQNGSVKSADFERKDGVKGTWWNWKIEKDALEYWFAVGELMIARRERFQRVYDLRERVYPEWQDSAAPPQDEAVRALCLKAVRALGIAQTLWVEDYFRLPRKLVQQALSHLLSSGQVVEGAVDGWKDPVLVAADRLSDLDDAVSGRMEPCLTTLLSPFDALIWNRARTKQLFNFDFSIECYLPPARRKYGYYLLPILHRGNLVGRLDGKAHRKDGIFEVKSLYLEPSAALDDGFAGSLAKAIQRCAEWHRTPLVKVSRVVPDEFTSVLLNYF